MEVKVLYKPGEEKLAKEILKALYAIHRDKFFFSWVAYKETRGMLNGRLNEVKN